MCLQIQALKQEYNVKQINSTQTYSVILESISICTRNGIFSNMKQIMHEEQF